MAHSRRCKCGCGQELRSDESDLRPGHTIPAPRTAAEIPDGMVVLHDPQTGATWLDSGRRADIRVCHCGQLRSVSPHFRLAGERTWNT